MRSLVFQESLDFSSFGILTYSKHPLWSLRCADQVMIGLGIEGLEGDDRGCPNNYQSIPCLSIGKAANPKEHLIRWRPRPFQDHPMKATASGGSRLLLGKYVFTKPRSRPICRFGTRETGSEGREQEG
jgi:hypothetical protein